MHTRRWIEAALCTGLLLVGRSALGQASPPAAQPQPATSDQQFLQQAQGVNELELQLGHLATQRATTPQVKAMGQTMIKKHTELGRQLSDLARQSGLSGAAEMSPDQRATLARMESQPASTFDAAFKQTVDAGHVKELAMYQAEASRTSNPQLRALAEQRVAALQKPAVGTAQQPSKVERATQ